MNSSFLIRTAAIGAGALALLGGAWTAVASPVFAPTDGTLSSAVAADLTHMRDEERLARDLYAAIATQYDNAAPFSTITLSEQRHYDSVGVLLTRYGVADPSAGKAPGVYSDPELQKLYDSLWAQAKTSLTDAYAVGVAVENTDIADLKKAMAATDAADIDRVYANLERGSEMHLQSFTDATNGVVTTHEVGMQRMPNTTATPGAGTGMGNGYGGGNGVTGGRMGAGAPMANGDCTYR